MTWTPPAIFWNLIVGDFRFHLCDRDGEALWTLLQQRNAAKDEGSLHFRFLDIVGTPVIIDLAEPIKMWRCTPETLQREAEWNRYTKSIDAAKSPDNEDGDDEPWKRGWAA